MNKIIDPIISRSTCFVFFLEYARELCIIALIYKEKGQNGHTKPTHPPTHARKNTDHIALALLKLVIKMSEAISLLISYQVGIPYVSLPVPLHRC